MSEEGFGDAKMIDLGTYIPVETYREVVAGLRAQIKFRDDEIAALSQRVADMTQQQQVLMDKRIAADEERDRFAKRVADMTRALEQLQRALTGESGA